MRRRKGVERVYIQFPKSLFWKAFFFLLAVLLVPKPLPLLPLIKKQLAAIEYGPLWGLWLWLYFTIRDKGRELCLKDL